MEDKETIRRRYSLVQFIEQIGGVRAYTGRYYVLFHSPFRVDNNPSFAVFDDERWKDFATGDSGDLFDAVIKAGYATNFKGACEYLSDNSQPIAISNKKPPARPSVTPQAAPRYTPTIQDIFRFYKNAYTGEKAPRLFFGQEPSPYMVTLLMDKRSIDLEVAQNRLLGSKDELFYYTTLDGKTFTFPKKNVVIPNFFVHPKTNEAVVFGYIMRYDPWHQAYWFHHAYNAAVYQYRFKEGPVPLMEVQFDWLKRNNHKKTLYMPIEMMLEFYEIFTPKVKYKRQGNIRTYANDLLVKPSDNARGWDHKIQRYIIVVESELCALAMISKGYSTVAIRPQHNLDFAKIFEGVSVVYLMYDNDEAGEKYTKMAIDQLGTKANIIPVLKGYKDPGEVIVEGKTDEWLSRYPIASKPASELRLPEINGAPYDIKAPSSNTPKHSFVSEDLKQVNTCSFYIRDTIIPSNETSEKVEKTEIEAKPEPKPAIPNSQPQNVQADVPSRVTLPKCRYYNEHFANSPMQNTFLAFLMCCTVDEVNLFSEPPL